VAPSLLALSSPRGLLAMWSTQVMRSRFMRLAVIGHLSRFWTLPDVSSVILGNRCRSALATPDLHRPPMVVLRHLHYLRNERTRQR